MITSLFVLRTKEGESMTARFISRDDPANDTGFDLGIPESSGEKWDFQPMPKNLTTYASFHRAQEAWMNSLTEEDVAHWGGGGGGDDNWEMRAERHFEQFLQSSPDRFSALEQFNELRGTSKK